MRQFSPKTIARVLAPAAIPLAMALTVTPARGRDPIVEIPSGTMLGRENWEIAQGRLPDEILEFYKRGDYSNPIVQKPGSEWLTDRNQVEISNENAGKFDVDENGSVVAKTTGKRPPVIVGWPFPAIDPKDPAAGAKVVWNWFYTLYWEGSFHTNSRITWVSRDGPVRQISTDVHSKNYDGNPPRFQALIGDNPLDLLSRSLGIVKEPVDVNGIINMNWRYREGDQQDNTWTYVPALRRVRAINPANRSDGVLGSDISLDDGSYFDAKPEDFEFKLVGDAVILAPFDGKALQNGSPIRPLRPDEVVSDLVGSSSTGWRLASPEYPQIPSQTPTWTRKDGENLIAWAPIEYALVPRPVWVVHATPKNAYYLFGKIVMYFDKDTFRGYWKNKYDWRGNALVSWSTPAMPSSKVETPDHGDFWLRTGGGGSAAFAVNYKQDRATVAGMPVEDAEYHVQIADRIFELDTVQRMGK